MKFHSNLAQIWQVFCLYLDQSFGQTDGGTDWLIAYLIFLSFIYCNHSSHTWNSCLFFQVILSQDGNPQRGSNRRYMMFWVLGINTKQACMKAVACRAMDMQGVKRETENTWASKMWIAWFSALCGFDVTHRGLSVWLKKKKKPYRVSDSLCGIVLWMQCFQLWIYSDLLPLHCISQLL